MSSIGIPGYYINLDRAAKRREHMEQQASRYGLALTRISGVEGSSFSPDQLLVYQPASSPKRRLTAGEIACFLSHRAAWQRIVDGSTRYGAVFEDDVLLSPDAAELLHDDHWLPQGADLVKTETFMRKVVLASVVSRTPGNRMLARLLHTHYGTAGYIVSQSSAARLLAATEIFHVPVDLAMFSRTGVVLKDLNVLQISPAICVQEMCAGQLGTGPGLERSSLFQARTVAIHSAEHRSLSVTKSAGRALEDLIREARQRFKAWRIGGNWGIVEFR